MGGNPLGYIDPLGLASATMDDFRRQRPRPFLDAILGIPGVAYVAQMCSGSYNDDDDFNWPEDITPLKNREKRNKERKKRKAKRSRGSRKKEE